MHNEGSAGVKVETTPRYWLARQASYGPNNQSSVVKLKGECDHNPGNESCNCKREVCRY